MRITLDSETQTLSNLYGKELAPIQPKNQDQSRGLPFPSASCTWVIVGMVFFHPGALHYPFGLGGCFGDDFLPTPCQAFTQVEGKKCAFRHRHCSDAADADHRTGSVVADRDCG